MSAPGGARAPGVMELPGMERFTGAEVGAARERALTEEQEQAVARRGEPLLVSAAAGSGKTSVLVERFIRAVREDGTAPGRILAITFTERAAGELRSRVRERLLELGDRAAARDTEAAFVGTFHAFCARLLRAHPLAARAAARLRDPRRGARRPPARGARSPSPSRAFSRTAAARRSTCSPPTASTARGA